MKKRNLFAELTEGFEALAAQREGKITLREHAVEINPAPEITSAEVLSIRQKLNYSRPVFARYLRVKERTLETWEQGRSKPNAQAAILIKLAGKYPDTFDRISVL